MQINYGAVQDQEEQLPQINQEDGEGESCCARNLPRPKDVLAGFITVFKRRPGKTRMMILMLIFNFACYIFAYNGQEGTHR